MSLSCTFVCPLDNGVHARPAGAIEELARRFTADVTLTNERTNRAADARSVLAIVALDIQRGDPCRVTAAGVDAREAIGAFEQFLASDFPNIDVQPPAPAPGQAVALPRLLASSGATVLRGVPAVPGVGLGRLVRLRRTATLDTIPDERTDDVEREAARLDAALHQLVERYEAQADSLGPGDAADVILAHRSVARDPEFARYLHQVVRTRRSAARAIHDAERHFAGMLRAASSQVLRERALDVRDVCQQLLREIRGERTPDHHAALTAESVCVADALTPGEFLALDRTLLRGLVLAQGSTTTHAVILARSFGVPTISGLDLQDDAAADGAEVVVDGDVGVLVTQLTAQARRYYGMERRRLEARGTRIRRRALDPAVTEDGVRVEVAANIATAEEAVSAFAAGADGIGVFRTEMLFTGRTHPPGEDVQLEQYRRVVSEAAGKRVVVRLLDVGGDKPMPYLKLPREQNPFLGYRAVRIYPAHEPLIRAQVRAAIRASGSGPIGLLIPFVSILEEVAWVRDLVAEEHASCVGAGVPCEDRVPLGVMIEVPSCAYLMDRLAAEVAFFSIGTNDLLQYFFAADRGNRSVAGLYDPLHPAFLRFLSRTVAGARARGRPVAVCGEMAGDREALPLLVGAGVEELSLVAPRIPDVKSEIRTLRAADCRTLLDEALGCATAAEVRERVRAFGRARPAALASADLVVVDSASASRVEALKELADLLYVAGRTDRPREVEHALWARESLQSTAFGHGFAIPHCATDAVQSNSVAVLRLAHEIEWGGGDHGPVRAVVLVAVRQTNAGPEHLAVLARLARRLVHEDFRAAILSAPDATAVSELVQGALALDTRRAEA